MKGRIYKIVCNETGKIYIGSTINSIKARLATHKNKSNNCISKEIIAKGNYEIILIEQIDIENMRDLRRKEAEYIRNSECINKIIPFRSKEEKKKLIREYQQKEKFKNYSREYYKVYYQNSEKINCFCGGGYRACQKNKHFKTNRHKNAETAKNNLLCVEFDIFIAENNE